MHNDIYELINSLNKYKKIYIYGAGRYGRCVFELLSHYGLEHRIQGFIVTQKDNNSSEYPIITIGNYCSASGSIIVVAVNNNIVYEIESELIKHGVTDYLNILDYSLEYEDKEIDNKLDYYRKLKSEDLQKEIKTENSRICFYKKKKKELLDKSICIILGIVTARMARIIIALSGLGYNIEVIEYRRLLEDEYVGNSKLKKHNVIVKRCYVMEEAIKEAFISGANKYIVDSPFADASITEIMIRNRELFGKIIFTAYDNYLGTYSNPNLRKMETEKYCLQHADGIIWRYYSKEFIARTFKINYQGKNIQFLDCCDFFDFDIDVNDSEEELNLCLVVNHAFELLEHEASKFVRTAGLEEILSRIRNYQNVHIDVYVWSVSKEEKIDISKIEKKYKQINIFYHVQNSDLMQRLHNYDYGILIMTDGEIPEWPEHADRGYEKIYSEGAYRYSLANRLFEYISAGLPIVTTTPELLCDELERGGALVKMNLSNLDIEYLKTHKRELKMNAIKLKDKYRIDNRIGELAAFIDSI